MIPDEIPKFTNRIVLKPFESTEYEEGQKKSTIGWLKHLFLWRYEKENGRQSPRGDYLNITKQDRRDYEGAVEVFKRANGMTLKTALWIWEEKTPVNQQVKALNNFRRAWQQLQKELQKEKGKK